MAQLTITVPDQHVPEVLAAIGAEDAAGARQWVIDQIKEAVRWERQKAAEQAARAAISVDPVDDIAN